MNVSGIEVALTRKAIKNMHLHVKPPDGAVTLSAPLHVSDEQLRRFVQDKAEWIRRQQARIAAQPRPVEPRYVTGEPFLLWGRRYRLVVEHAARSSLRLSGGEAILTVRQSVPVAGRQAIVREWYREQLKAEVTRLLPRWQEATGLHCDSWQTKQMTSRWGSCNIAKRKVWLSLELAKHPIECLEYVILHELAHLKVKDHGPGFKALMDEHMPNWREVRGRLNGQVEG